MIQNITDRKQDLRKFFIQKTPEKNMVKSDFEELMMRQDLSQPLVQKFLVVDDHPLVLNGCLSVLQQQYPHVEILKAETAQEVLEQVEKSQFNLVVTDLSIPEKLSKTADTETGIQLLRSLMKKYTELNLVVQSSYVKALVRIKHEIDEHEGGFAIVDKGLPVNEMLNRVNLALQNGTHTKDIKTGLELKPEWWEVLKLAYREGLQDRAIAEQMKVAERTVRSYWTKIQDVLGVYPEDCKQGGKSLRIQTEIRARKEGLIH